MVKIRRQHSEAFKFKVALAALRGDKTQSELIQQFSVCESLIQKWKNHLVQNGAEVFSSSTSKSQTDVSQLEISKLHEKIGQLVIERDYLKKTLDY